MKSETEDTSTKEQFVMGVNGLENIGLNAYRMGMITISRTSQGGWSHGRDISANTVRFEPDGFSASLDDMKQVRGLVDDNVLGYLEFQALSVHPIR